MPLQPARGVGERAVLLGEAGGRQAEDFGLDLRRVDVVVLAEVAPELGRLGGQRIGDDQEFQLRERQVELVLVGRRGQRIESLADEAGDLAPGS